MRESPDRVERLLALLLVQSLKSQREKIAQLSVAGFSSVEIADILQTTSAVVRQVLYTARRSRAKKSGGKASPGG